jgi:hypothetical protein
MTQRQEGSLGVILPDQLVHHGAALKRIKGDSNEFQHFTPGFYADEPGQKPK